MCGCGTAEWCEGGCSCGCDHGTPEGMGRQGRHLAWALAAWKQACALHGDAYNEGVEWGQRDMLAKCIAAVEFLHDHNPDQASAFWYAINELRALQQPTGPIADLTDEEADAYYEALQEKP